MSDGHALMSACLADANDALSRAALADWLEERGDRRAARVRGMRPDRVPLRVGKCRSVWRIEVDGDWLKSPPPASSVVVLLLRDDRPLWEMPVRPGPGSRGGHITTPGNTVRGGGLSLALVPLDFVVVCYVAVVGAEHYQVALLSRAACEVAYSARLRRLLRRMP
jgi:uncharacterized protein (TIGR02996 family)